MSATATLAPGGSGTPPVPGTATTVITDPGAAPPGAPIVPTSPGSAIDTKWLGENVPDDLKGYVQNKGWKGGMEAVEGYRNLEKLVGEKRLALPKDENDAEGLSKVYDALGRPKNPADYKLPVPEGTDPKFAEAAAKVMHEAGLGAKQAQKLATWWNDQMAAGAKAAEEAAQRQREQDIEAVRTEWGGATTERVETVKRAERTFLAEFGDDIIDKMENGMGVKQYLAFMYRIGSAIGEHGGAAGLDSQRPGSGSALTPDQAKAEITRLRADPVWVKAYTSGGSAERARMDQLQKWAHPA